ncbi:hypothetical protein EJB05_19646 [Eragrostis curvula]|uniref:Uncharacterized protein n=1 Tax=Eragrostis curvula TaxID=38414 RepID=A0A5J9UYG9_9POAL|nr:hypothetical protein EJB05_19646 [Eragrostis curvula]
MVRSALCRVSRRLSGSSAAPLVMRRRGPETLQAPPRPSLRSAATWIPHPGPPMRAFTSPAAAAPTRRIPNTQVNLVNSSHELAVLAKCQDKAKPIEVRQHLPVISTKGMKWAEQKRFLSMESKEPVIKRVVQLVDRHFGPRRQFIFATFIGVSSFMATSIIYHWLD